MAYSNTQRGATTIYVHSFPATGEAPYLLEPNGADIPHHPRWSRDGKELFYNPKQGRQEVVSITTHPSFGFGKRIALPKKFTGGPPESRTSYDVTLDGKFVGFIDWGQTQRVFGSNTQIQVIMNWFEDLKAKAPRR